MAVSLIPLLFTVVLFPFRSAALSLDLCPLNATDFISNTNVTWGAILDLPIRDLGGSSYLRPDIGGALLPYVYTIIILIAHIPIVVIRVVRWQKVQTWCLAATVLTLAVTIQGFVSTQFAPEKILTWTPLLLVIDAGSMAQVFFLIIEDEKVVANFNNAFRPSRKPEGSILLEAAPNADQYGGVFCVPESGVLY